MSESAFTKLAAINVNDKIEKKNGLSYLSWAWAVDQLLRVDPAAVWEYPEPTMFGQTMMVHCSVKAFGKTMMAHLPVMDHRNKPIPNPDAFAVNTAMQRCLVKAIALHGLGLYIYAGEDLPEGEEAPQKPKDAPGKGPTITPAEGAWESQSADMQDALREFAKDVTNQVASGAVKAAIDAIDAKEDSWWMDEMCKVAFWTLLDSKTRSAIKRAKEEASMQAAVNRQKKAA